MIRIILRVVLLWLAKVRDTASLKQVSHADGLESHHYLSLPASSSVLLIVSSFLVPKLPSSPVLANVFPTCASLTAGGLKSRPDVCVPVQGHT